MNRYNEDLITSNDLTYFLIGSVIGMSVLSLPNDVVEIARQDGWISTIIGGWYPLYVVLIASIVVRKCPDNNILFLSKKYMGKTIGSILNFIHMLTFLLFTIIITVYTSNIIQIYGVPFVSNGKICSIALALGAYGAYKGINVLGKVDKYIFFLMVALILISFTGLKYGSILNIQPVFGSGSSNILKAVKGTFAAYAMMEVLLLVYPYVKDKKGITKAGLKCAWITILIYAWVVFITIYFLGVNIVPKSYWSFIMVNESIQLPIINNFRFIFMFLWLISSFRVIANQYYAVSLILNDLFKLDRKKLCIFILPIAFYLTTRFENEIMRRDFVGKVMPFVVGFNIAYISIVTLFTVFHRKKPLLNKDQDLYTTTNPKT